MAPKKITEYSVTSWYMEYREGSSDKFYHVFVSETGVCLLRWGRRGTAGQNSCTRYSTLDEARTQGLKQVYAKQSKGYVQKHEFSFLAHIDHLDAAQRGNPAYLVSAWKIALQEGEFTTAKTAVLRHYAEFAERVNMLLNDAGSADMGDSMEEFNELEKVWEEINDKHGEVAAAFDLTRMTLMQKLISSGHA